MTRYKVLAQDAETRPAQRPHAGTQTDRHKKKRHAEPVRPPAICMQRHATALL